MSGIRDDPLERDRYAGITNFSHPASLRPPLARSLARGLNPGEIFASCPAFSLLLSATLRAFEFPVPDR
jgi:hypothetical protein